MGGYKSTVLHQVTFGPGTNCVRELLGDAGHATETRADHLWLTSMAHMKSGEQHPMGFRLAIVRYLGSGRWSRGSRGGS